MSNLNFYSIFDFIIVLQHCSLVGVALSQYSMTICITSSLDLIDSDKYDSFHISICPHVLLQLYDSLL